MRQRLQLYVSAFELNRLREIAARNQQTVSDFIRDALNEAIEECDDRGPVFKQRRWPQEAPQ